jgi:ribosomal protein S18 acetylase RimI-like enzyme
VVSCISKIAAILIIINLRMPPGQNMDDLWTIFRSGMWRLNYRLSPEGKRRFFTEFLPLLHDAKHATLRERDDEAWYLVYIGTKPSGRGKGYCRKLIEHVTQQADIEGRATYLESSNEANPPIYRKFGFEEKRTIYLHRAEKNIPLDIMVREPQGQQVKAGVKH